MNAPDPEDQAWRITFVRLLLSVLLLYYLATIVIVEYLRPSLATMRDLSAEFALMICFAFAFIALNRLRGEALVALATAALLSIWVLVSALSYTPILKAVLSRPSNWRLDLALLLVVATCSLPTVTFFVVWPLRPSLPNTYVDSAGTIEVGRVPESPDVPPE